MDASLAELLPRAMGSMVVVLAIMWIAARATKTKKFGTTFGTRINRKSAEDQDVAIELISRQPLGRNTSISIVRAGDKKLVLGITESQVSLLAELDDPESRSSLNESRTSQSRLEESKFTESFRSHPSATRNTARQQPALSLVDTKPKAGSAVKPIGSAHWTGATKSNSNSTTEQAWKGLLEQVREKTVRH